VKCYNYEKNGHFPQDCLEVANIPLSTKTSELCVCSSAFVTNSLPQWMLDMDVKKHIIQGRAEFVEFHRYVVGS